MTPISLHAIYCRESGHIVHFRTGPADTRCERAWIEFAKVFTETDLVLVLRTLRRGVKSGERKPGCLRFSNLIERLDLFDEELAMARASERNARRPETNREAVLRATGRNGEPMPEPKTPRVILDDFAKAELAKMREAAK